MTFKLPTLSGTFGKVKFEFPDSSAPREGPWESQVGVSLFFECRFPFTLKNTYRIRKKPIIYFVPMRREVQTNVETK